MNVQRSGALFAAVAATAVALLLSMPGLISEHLEAPGHDHEGFRRVAVEAVHTTLPAHFDSSASTAERICSACLLQGRTVIRRALLPAVAFLPPASPIGQPVSRWSPTKPQRRLDLSRAPPSLL